MIEKSQIRYIAAKPTDMTGKYSFNLMPDSDTLAIAELQNSAKCYPQAGQVDEDLVILSVVVGKSLEAEFAFQVDLDDPMSDENEMVTVQTLDIAGKTFRSLENVKIAFPQTAGTYEIKSMDEDGNEIIITRDKMQEVNWAL